MTPSGRIPFFLNKPNGSSVEGRPAADNNSLIRILQLLCLRKGAAIFEQMSANAPSVSQKETQTHLKVLAMGAPSL